MKIKRIFILLLGVIGTFVDLSALYLVADQYVIPINFKNTKEETLFVTKEIELHYISQQIDNKKSSC